MRKGFVITLWVRKPPEKGTGQHPARKVASTNLTASNLKPLCDGITCKLAAGICMWNRQRLHLEYVSVIMCTNPLICRAYLIDAFLQ